MGRVANVTTVDNKDAGKPTKSHNPLPGHSPGFATQYLWGSVKERGAVWGVKKEGKEVVRHQGPKR